MYKKAWCTCEVVVLLIKPIVFWRSRCRPRRGVLKSEFTQRRRRRLRKRHLKSEFALPRNRLYRAHSISFHLSIVGKFFLELNAKGLHESSRKEKWESCCLLFPSSTKREIRQFHVVVVQRRQRNVQKNVMHVQNCCFACLNLLLFCRSRSPRRRRRCVNSLKSLMEDEDFYLRRKWPSKTI